MKQLTTIVMATLLSLTAAAQTRISCVGASITEGYGTSQPWSENSYPGQMGRLLGPAYAVENYGRGGCTMLRKGDCPYWDKEKYGPSMASRPDIVFIDLGGNDAKLRNRVHKADFVDDACELVYRYQHLPSQPRVILMTAIPGFTSDSTEIWDVAIRRDINPLILEAARRMHVEVIDMHPVMADHPELMPDQVHPNDEGARMMGAKMAWYLQTYPEKPSADMTIDGMVENPIIRHIYTADPSAHVWRGTIQPVRQRNPAHPVRQ